MEINNDNNDNNNILLNRIETLSEQFHSSYRTTHPVLSKLWINSLEDCKLKLYSIKKLVEQGESLIEKLFSNPNDINDPNITTILTLLSLLSERENNDNDSDRV